MRFGLLTPCDGHFLSSPDQVAAYTRAAEDAGFESIWVFEHPVIGGGSVLSAVGLVYGR